MARIEGWRPSSVIGVSVIALLAVALIVVCATAIAGDLWGEPLFDTVGKARPRPVWMVWVATVAGIGVGLTVLTASVGYLYRVVRGRVPRVYPARTDD